MGVRGQFHLGELGGGTKSRVEDQAEEEADRVDSKP
jgi:hypothetical protein